MGGVRSLKISSILAQGKREGLEVEKHVRGRVGLGKLRED